MSRRKSALGSACLASLTLLVPVTALGQDGRPDERRPSEGQPGRRGGGEGDQRAEQFSRQAVEFLAKELDLDPKQREQVQAILRDEVRATFETMRKYYEDMFTEGPNPETMEKMRKAFEEARINISKKVSTVLTPAQRREFEVLVEQFDRRANEFEQGREADDDISQLYNPKPPSKAILMAKAERALIATPEETAAIMPLVGRVVDKRIALYEGRRARRGDLLNATRSGAPQKEIVERLAQIRAAEQFQRLELLAAQERLRDVLSISQETQYVVLGLLD